MKVLFLGDSITAGVPGVSYVQMIGDMCQECTLVNRGIGGDTVSSLLRRVKKMEDLESFDSIVVFVGVNDVFGKVSVSYKLLKTIYRQRWAKNALMFSKQYQELMDVLITYNKNILIVPPLLLGEDIQNKWNRELAKLRTIVEEVAKDHDLVYVDVYQEFVDYLKGKTLSSYLPMTIRGIYKDVRLLKSQTMVDEVSKRRNLHLTLDGVHINSEGARIISNAITKQWNDL